MLLFVRIASKRIYPIQNYSAKTILFLRLKWPSMPYFWLKRQYPYSPHSRVFPGVREGGSVVKDPRPRRRHRSTHVNNLRWHVMGAAWKRRREKKERLDARSELTFPCRASFLLVVTLFSNYALPNWSPWKLLTLDLYTEYFSRTRWF